MGGVVLGGQVTSDNHLSAFLDLRVNEVGPPLEHLSSLLCVLRSVVDITENQLAPTGWLRTLSDLAENQHHLGVYMGVSLRFLC